MLADMDILSYPKNLKVRDYYDHVERLNLKVLIGDTEHFVTWTVPWEFDFEPEDRLTDIHIKFIEFVKYVSKLVIESREYQSLHKASGGYL